MLLLRLELLLLRDQLMASELLLQLCLQCLRVALVMHGVHGRLLSIFIQSHHTAVFDSVWEAPLMLQRHVARDVRPWTSPKMVVVAAILKWVYNSTRTTIWITVS